MVAVSGGPDSTAMLAVLDRLRARWNWELLVVHVNHGLRGRESEQDAEFVRSLGATLQVEVVVASIPIEKADARNTQRSLQDYARWRRYDALAEVAASRQASCIAVGHTADDQAETVVMRMVRGSGAGGLSGIPPMRNQTIVRPLIDVTRREVLAYLAARGFGYRVDRSNHELIYLRNRIRHEVMPILLRYNPNLVQVLSRQADVLREEDAYLDELAVESWRRAEKMRGDGVGVLDRTALVTCPVPIRRRVLRLVLQHVAHLPYKPGFEIVDAILSQVVERPSGSAMAAFGIRICRQYEEIWFTDHRRIPSARAGQTDPVLAVLVPSAVNWTATGQTLTFSLDARAPSWARANDRLACFDRATFSEPLIVRTWRPGDYFYPLGMAGKRKKLQDFFADAKIPKAKRHHIPIVAAPEGILWVGGYRMDHRFRLTDATRDVMAATILEGGS